MGIGQRLKGRRVYFDANIFIYLVEGYARFQKSLDDISESLLRQEVEIFTSEVTLCEVLVAPLRDKKSELVVLYRQFIENSGAFTLLPTARETFVRASLIRARERLKLADAIHVATAVEAGCSAFVSNDQGIKLPRNIERLEL